MEKLLIEEIIGGGVSRHVRTYGRFIFNKVLYHTLEYKKLKKRNNSTAVTSNKDIISIQELVRVTVEKDQSVHFLLKTNKYTPITEEHMCKVSEYPSNHYSCLARKSDNLSYYRVDCLEDKCVLMPYSSEKFCIVRLVNRYERD